MSDTTTSSSSSMDFSGHLSDAQLQLVRAGFTDKLWVPEFGWENAEQEESMTPQPPQLLAGIQLFNQLFVSSDARAWAHLAAEMQAGKTGAVNTLIRLVLSNAHKLHVRPNRIFILTGMNDDAWKMQTRSRMPSQLHTNIQHSSGLGKVAMALHRLLERDQSESLSDILIILDESHIAAAQNNQPYKQIWTTLQRLCPIEKWQENNIRVVTISATDPAKVMAISSETRLPTAVVRLQTTEQYQSVEKLVVAGRVRYTDKFGDLHLSEFKGVKYCAINEIKRCIEEDLDTNSSYYHILRPRLNKHQEVARILKEVFPEATILFWDASSKSSRNKGAGDDSTSGCEMNDINSILGEAPATTTFILIKNMFYAAKTLDDTYVGVLYDRISDKDDTNLQSLLGRACGYGKSDTTYIYTSRQTVDNYLSCWRELCSNPSAPRLVNIPASVIHRKMTGIHASVVTSGESCRITVTSSVRTPIGSLSSDLVGAGAGGAARAKADENNFTSEWSECDTFEQAKALSPQSRKPRMNEQGFYQTSTTGNVKTVRYDEMLAMMGGKKTANMPWGSLEVGKSVNRLYVAYKNMNDPKSAVFIIRTLTRIA